MRIVNDLHQVNFVLVTVLFTEFINLSKINQTFQHLFFQSVVFPCGKSEKQTNYHVNCKVHFQRLVENKYQHFTKKMFLIVKFMFNNVCLCVPH